MSRVPKASVLSWAAVFLLLAVVAADAQHLVTEEGAIVRGRVDRPELALVFTGDEYGDGLEHITDVLRQESVPAAFFFTGRFYRNRHFSSSIDSLIAHGHYVGAHSDQHLLYNSWENRDSLLVTRTEFTRDVLDNYAEMERFGVETEEARYFMPPYEWYNRTIADWTGALGLRLINYSPGTRSHADYTTPDLPHYVSSDSISASILEHEEQDPAGLNGFILLSHVGTAPERTDKFYLQLESIINILKDRGYTFVRIDSLLAD